jgi:hypothetical protein
MEGVSKIKPEHGLSEMDSRNFVNLFFCPIKFLPDRLALVQFHVFSHKRLSVKCCLVRKLSFLKVAHILEKSVAQESR